MKIQWFRSATVGIYSKSGTSILCDPWITDGAFIGSWFHWPPLEGFEFSELAEKKMGCTVYFPLSCGPF
jgi:UDP-MurNAc hydroxylase